MRPNTIEEGWLEQCEAASLAIFGLVAPNEPGLASRTGEVLIIFCARLNDGGLGGMGSGFTLDGIWEESTEGCRWWLDWSRYNWRPCRCLRVHQCAAEFAFKQLGSPLKTPCAA